MAFFTPLVTERYSMFVTAGREGELLISDQPNINNVTRSVMYTMYAVLATPFSHIFYMCMYQLFFFYINIEMDEPGKLIITYHK